MGSGGFILVESAVLALLRAWEAPPAGGSSQVIRQGNTLTESVGISMFWFVVVWVEK